MKIITDLDNDTYTINLSKQEYKMLQIENSNNKLISAAILKILMEYLGMHKKVVNPNADIDATVHFSHTIDGLVGTVKINKIQDEFKLLDIVNLL